MLGVTRWKALTPLRLEERVKAAQSMGEWPGARRTLPRALGIAVVEVGARPPLTRCWELAGGPLFGRGPFEGTRREAAALGGGMADGREGGGISPGEPFGARSCADLGGRGVLEARWALSAAGNRGTGGFGGGACFDSSGALPFREKVGTSVSGSVTIALGVLSASSGDVTSIVTRLCSSSPDSDGGDDEPMDVPVPVLPS